MKIRILAAMVASSCGLLAASENLTDTVRVPLWKLDEPLSYCTSSWMSGKKHLVHDSADSARVVEVHTSLQNGIPLTLDFSNPDSVMYRFSAEYRNITVPVDSMKLYRRRRRGEAEGHVPSWNIGTIRKDGADFSVWIVPDGNVAMPEGPTKFLDDFLVTSLVGNKYSGTVNTPDGPFSLTVHRPSERTGKDMFYITILPEGKYEDFSSYVPQIAYGVTTSRLRNVGSTVKLGADDIYLIDSITPGFEEVILTRTGIADSRLARISAEAMAELKPYVAAAAAQGKLLLIDFWGTWCRPCIMAMPKLKEMEEKYADRLMVLSVINDNPSNFERGKEILDKHGLTGQRLMREREPLVKLLNVESFPTYILLDKDGSILMHGSSAKALDWLENQSLVGKSGVER